MDGKEGSREGEREEGIEIGGEEEKRRKCKRRKRESHRERGEGRKDRGER